jgi:hypothetical protein
MIARMSVVIAVIAAAGVTAKPASASQAASCTDAAPCWTGMTSSVPTPGFTGVGANVRVNCIGGHNIYDEVEFGVQLVVEQNSQAAWYRAEIKNSYIGPRLVWVTYGPVFAQVKEHDAGPYSVTQSVPLWVVKNTSPGVQATILANGGHTTAEGVGWPADIIRTGVLRANSDSTYAYGSSSSMFYLTLSGDLHEGWDTSQTNPWGGLNPYLDQNIGLTNSGAYFVTWPSWMRAYNNTPSDGCPSI